MDPRRALTPFEGNPLWRRLFGDFDRFFEETNRPLLRRRAWLNEFAWIPEAEVAEREGKLFVHLDLPGVKPEEVTVTAADGYLTVQGERKQEAEKKEGEWFHTERTYGMFARAIRLPEGVKASAIAANFQNGVLEVIVPLPSAAIAAEPQRIPVGGATEKKEQKPAA